MILEGLKSKTTQNVRRKTTAEKRIELSLGIVTILSVVGKQNMKVKKNEAISVQVSIFIRASGIYSFQIVALKVTIR